MGRRKHEINPKSNQRLKDVMSKSGVSGRALRNKTGVSETTISKIINFKSALTPEIAAVISGPLGVSADYLLGKSDTENLSELDEERQRYDQLLKVVNKSIETILREEGYTIKKNEKDETVEIDYRFVTGNHKVKVISLRQYHSLINGLHNCIMRTMKMGFNLLESKKPDPEENAASDGMH